MGRKVMFNHFAAVDRKVVLDRTITAFLGYPESCPEREKIRSFGDDLLKKLGMNQSFTDLVHDYWPRAGPSCTLNTISDELNDSKETIVNKLTTKE